MSDDCSPISYGNMCKDWEDGHISGRKLTILYWSGEHGVKCEY